MIYNPKYKGGVCRVCGVKLPVQAWRTCLIHDKQSKRKVPFIKIKRPRTGKRVLCNLYYKGYKIDIPLEKFDRSGELLVDHDTWTIIGWR